MMNRKQLIAGLLVVAMVLSTTVAAGAFAGAQTHDSNDIGSPVEAMSGGFAQMDSEQHVMELLAETHVDNEHACLHGEYGDRIPLDAGGSIKTAPTVGETHKIWEVTYTQDAGYVVFDTSNYPYSDKFVFYTANGTVQPLEGTVVKRGDVPECDSLDGYVVIKPEDGRIALKLNADSDEPEPPAQKTLRIEGTGEYAAYSFTVSGNLTLAEEDAEETVSGSTAYGAVDPDSDTYNFTGDLDELAVAGSATVYVNGEKVDPNSIGSDTTVVTFKGTGTFASYQFSASDTVKGGIYLDQEDSFSGSQGSGAVTAGQETFFVDGNITSVSTNGDVTVVKS